MIKKIIVITISTMLLTVGLFFGVKLYSKYMIGYTKTYVASHFINQRNQIKEEDLLEVEVPKDYLKNDVYIDKKDIIDKYVKLCCSIPKGSLIYKSSIETDIKDLANTLLKEGEVNYDIYVNEVKINTANIAKNMYVDIYLTINNKDKPISDLLLTNARITGLYDNNNKLILDYDNSTRISIVSLAVNKDDVNVLNKAQVLGSLNFVISNNAYKVNLSSMLNVKSPLFEYIN